jgi:hypothetical protein
VPRAIFLDRAQGRQSDAVLEDAPGLAKVLRIGEDEDQSGLEKSGGQVFGEGAARRDCALSMNASIPRSARAWHSARAGSRAEVLEYEMKTDFPIRGGMMLCHDFTASASAGN